MNMIDVNISVYSEMVECTYDRLAPGWAKVLKVNQYKKYRSIQYAITASMTNTTISRFPSLLNSIQYSAEDKIICVFTTVASNK